ncbi:MAG: hypothetical protein VX033_06775, partial [Verrucomicrobiota bacterium]|nr:hypothetical protein [Verrucomicrobiota bacterium]
KIHNVEQIATESKKLKEFNEDCVDLGRRSKMCEEEKGVFLMCEKLSGRLQSIGAEAKSKVRDRRAALDAATTEAEKKQIRRIYPNLPERVDQMYGYVSALAPKEEKQFHGKGMMYMSFYNQAKKKFKAKSVASDDDKAWRTKCKMKGHHRNSWRCPNSDKEMPTTHKKELLNFCSVEQD